MRIVVVGTGYVGLVTGTGLADMGYHVTCVDVDETKIAALKRNEIPIFEPGLAELVQQNVEQGRLHFTTELTAPLKGCDICFIAVGTPPGEDGSADTRQVLRVADNIADVVENSMVVAVKSTVPVGTCDAVSEHLARGLARRGVQHVLPVVSNPEFLKEGAAIDDFMRPDRIVVGSRDPDAHAMMRRLYAPFIRNGHPFIAMDVRSSEMTKYAANVMLAARISLVNEIANLCEPMGADIMSVRQGVGADKRLGMAFLYPGLGYGGSCFPKDVQALRALGLSQGMPMDMMNAIEAVNQRQRMRPLEMLQSIVGDLKGQHVAIWGLAFKPRTDDVREAPAVAIIRRLVELGAQVTAYDPEANATARDYCPEGPNLRYVADAYEALDGATALILCTEWGAFRNPDFSEMKRRMANPRIFDGRNQYDPNEMRRMGFTYRCIGRPS